jgi:hypothetical protein
MIVSPRAAKITSNNFLILQPFEHGIIQVPTNIVMVVDHSQQLTYPASHMAEPIEMNPKRLLQVDSTDDVPKQQVATFPEDSSTTKGEKIEQHDTKQEDAHVLGSLEPPPKRLKLGKEFKGIDVQQEDLRSKIKGLALVKSE